MSRDPSWGLSLTPAIYSSRIPRQHGTIAVASFRQGINNHPGGASDTAGHLEPWRRTQCPHCGNFSFTIYKARTPDGMPCTVEHPHQDVRMLRCRCNWFRTTGSTNALTPILRPVVCPCGNDLMMEFTAIRSIDILGPCVVRSLLCSRSRCSMLQSSLPSGLGLQIHGPFAFCFGGIGDLKGEGPRFHAVGKVGGRKGFVVGKGGKGKGGKGKVTVGGKGKGQP